MSKEQKNVGRENISIPIFQRFAVKHFGVSRQTFLSLIFDFSNPKMKILDTINLFKSARYNELYTVFSVDQYKLVAYWIRHIAM